MEILMCILAIYGLGMLCWLIGAGLKSVGSKISQSPSESMTEEEFRKIKEQLGPMTLKEHIVSAVLIILLVAIVVWIASVT